MDCCSICKARIVDRYFRVNEATAVASSVCLLFFAVAASAQCVPVGTNQTVTICSPAAGAVGGSPVRVSASAKDSNLIKILQLYVDGAKVYEVANSQMQTSVPLTSGTHRLAVQAQDSTNAIFKTSEAITVDSSTGGGISQVKHIFFFVQEDRSVDSHFGVFAAYHSAYGGTFDGNPLNAVALPIYDGNAYVSPFHFQTVCTESMSPGWNESHAVIDGGKMDNYMKQEPSTPSTIDQHGTRAMGYYDQSDLPYYYKLAAEYATSDRWFAPLLATTIPNRMYLFAATSFGHIHPDAPPPGGWTQATIFRVLSQHGISWRYYVQDTTNFLSSFVDGRTYRNHIYNISSYYNDIRNPATLPQVIFIERASFTGFDEHPNANTQKGAADAANLINAFLRSPSYASSVFILTYSEAGGQYDHVPPFAEGAPDSIAPIREGNDGVGSFNSSGLRVPVIVISPWTKPHFVSHVHRDSTAILKFIETRFNMPPLTKRDGAQDNMLEFFDFSKAQISTPPVLPPQPTGGICNQALEKAPGF